MANLIAEEGRQFSDPNDIDSQIREYIKLKSTMDVMEKRSKELREKIFEFLDTSGEEDSAGNIVVRLAQPIDGVLTVQKTRRTKRVLDESTAEAIIEQAGIADDVYETKRVINEGALMAAFYNDQISEDQLDSMFPNTVSWALNTLKK